MSYLNVPRLHFTGRFQADPSTVNNNDNNFDPTAKFTTAPADPGQTNNSVYWNPNGTHNWTIDGRVRGAVGPSGRAVSNASVDPLIGAKVHSAGTAGTYPAKLVDLDPDNMNVSQIWGLEIHVEICDPKDDATVVASVTATMPPTAFGDLWNRTTNAPRPGMATMSAAFQAVLQNIKWLHPERSGLLAALHKASAHGLSIRFNVDSYQPDNRQANFTSGRIVGTIGPVLAGEAPRSTPRRLAPAFGSSIMTTFGPAGAVWDKSRSVLIVDLGNSVPTQWTPNSSPSVPNDGWPIATRTLQLTMAGAPVSALTPAALSRLKSTFDSTPEPVGGTNPAPFTFDTDTYLTWAGIVDIPIAATDWAKYGSKAALRLTDTVAAQPAVQEDAQGRYVDVDIPFFRLDPGDQATATLWATLFGEPWQTSLDLAVLAPGPANNNPGPPTPPGPEPYATWQVGTPEGVVTLTSGTQSGTAINVQTNAAGTGAVTLTAGDPRIPIGQSGRLVAPRRYSDGQEGPDGQLYGITGSWQAWGYIFAFPPAPLNVLVFNGHPMPSQPNWEDDVYPIFNLYARLAPYMKQIIDLSDYKTVTQKENAAAIQYVLSLPRENPHHMPIWRDLSRDKLAMIKKWFANGMPKKADTQKAT